MDEKALLRFETGTECHYHPREIVSRSRKNYPNNMADGAIYGRKLDLCWALRTFALIVETFLSKKFSIQSECVEWVWLSAAPISITRAYDCDSFRLLSLVYQPWVLFQWLLNITKMGFRWSIPCEDARGPEMEVKPIQVRIQEFLKEGGGGGVVHYCSKRIWMGGSKCRLSVKIS